VLIPIHTMILIYVMHLTATDFLPLIHSHVTSYHMRSYPFQRISITRLALLDLTAHGATDAKPALLGPGQEKTQLNATVVLTANMKLIANSAQIAQQEQA
jgi:hypothetical protein